MPQPAPGSEPAAPGLAPASRLGWKTLAAGAAAFLVFGLLAAGLVALVLLARSGGLPDGGSLAAEAGDFAYREAIDAPPLELTDQDGQPFSLDALRGRPVLVFFGYTHCPDVCPANVGTMNEALAQAGPGARVAFVSIDPERDDVAALKTYLRYLPPAYVGLTGTPDEIRRTADDWGVQYARIDTDSADGYAMAHTADMFLVDAQGRLRARFPFGTPGDAIAASLSRLYAETPPPPEPAATPIAPLPIASPSPSSTPPPTSPPPSPSATPGTPPASASPVPPPTSSPAPPSSPSIPGTSPAAGGLAATVVSTSVWAGGQSPVILTLSDAAGAPVDTGVPVRVRLVAPDGSQVGADVPAVAIRPPGQARVSYVATLDIPTPGQWRLDVLPEGGGASPVTLNVLDQGASARLGEPAPSIDTPTLTDVGGNLLAISTLPQADQRMYRESTADARAAGKPYVLVVDSARFKVSPACGRALSMVRYLLDRWPGVSFIHLEPFEYQLVTGEPVLAGDLTNPPMNQHSRALGLGDATWPGTEMPWIFVVDGDGIVRAKYTGIVGSADVDVILSQITGQGIIGG